MRFSLPSSLLLHGGLLAWVLVGFQEVRPFKPPELEPVEVAIITEDGLTRLRQGDRNSKNLEAAVQPKAAPPSPAVKETPKARPPDPTPPPPPPPEPAKVEPPPPPPKAEPPPPPKAEVPPPPPEKDEIAELALKAEAEAKAEAQRKAAEEKKRADEAKRADDKRKRDEQLKKQREAAAKKKQEDDRRKMAELAKQKPSEDFFDDMQKALKDNDPRKRAPQPSGPQVATASNVKGPLAGAPEGKDTRITASEAGLLGSMMKRQVARCWNISSGADGVDRMRIEIEVRLSPDGRIQGQPRLVSRGSGPLYADMADSAMRALIQCQAYDLPKHLYKGGWDFMIVDFDPSRMF